MDLSGKPYKAFIERQEAIKKQYSRKQAEKQHSKGKLTAKERISLLFDNGSFEEIDSYVTPADQPVEFGKVERSYGDGVIVGHMDSSRSVIRISYLACVYTRAGPVGKVITSIIRRNNRLYRTSGTVAFSRRRGCYGAAARSVHACGEGKISLSVLNNDNT